MKIYIQFFKDRSLLTALFVLLCIEMILQTGVYKSVLKKNSYASNVNRITDHPISQKKNLEPNILIVGTSIAYEGISLTLLNEKLKPHGYAAQSVAVPGADLMVQDLSLRKNLEHFPGIKYILHINEIQMPWVVNQKYPSDAALSMISEFNKTDALKKLSEDEYHLGPYQIVYVLSRLFAYRKDLGEFFLGPDKRLKDAGKMRKEKKEAGLYSYENKYTPSMSLYSFSNLNECIKVTSVGSKIPAGSDDYHRDAIFRTCTLAKAANLPLEKNENTELYKKRLKNMYKYSLEKGIKVINVFPPLPVYLDEDSLPERIRFWKNEYSDILSSPLLDLSGSIPRSGNSDYYYDMIHLNRKGMEKFTYSIADSFIEQIIKQGKGN